MRMRGAKKDQLQSAENFKISSAFSFILNTPNQQGKYLLHHSLKKYRNRPDGIAVGAVGRDHQRKIPAGAHHGPSAQIEKNGQKNSPF